jgi:DNA-binding NarL/FixJ family response regulator
MEYRSMPGDYRVMVNKSLPVVLYFGALIAAILIAAQVAALRAPLDAGWAAGIAALAFLVAGIVVGTRLSGADPTPSDPLPGLLTPREIDVLRGIALGHSNREIAQHHFRSVNTVKTQVSQIYAKLGVSGRVQAVAKARDLGLLDAESPVRVMERRRPDG